jgi:CheY-like chemotaxis protein
MPISRKILIVDDEAELRDALQEQFSLLEEFEAIVVGGFRDPEAAFAAAEGLKRCKTVGLWHGPRSLRLIKSTVREAVSGQRGSARL